MVTLLTGLAGPRQVNLPARGRRARAGGVDGESTHERSRERFWAWACMAVAGFGPLPGGGARRLALTRC